MITGADSFSCCWRYLNRNVLFLPSLLHECVFFLNNKTRILFPTLLSAASCLFPFHAPKTWRPMPVPTDKKLLDDEWQCLLFLDHTRTNNLVYTGENRSIDPNSIIITIRFYFPLNLHSLYSLCVSFHVMLEHNVLTECASFSLSWLRCMQLNTLFFINIIHVLFVKMFAPSAAQSNRSYSYRKWFKSTLVLVPLFGVHYMFLMIFNSLSVFSREIEIVWLYVDLLFTSFQVRMFCDSKKNTASIPIPFSCDSKRKE